MTKKLLLIFTLLSINWLRAQTDEAVDATPIESSIDYQCNNAQTGNFEGFTKSAEFTCPGPEYNTWVDAWYRFTPTETKEYSIKIEALTGSIYDVRLGFYSGTPGNFTSLTGCATRYMSEELTMGETYYINIRGAYETTQYLLCIYPFPEPPLNADPATADQLLESTYDVCENAITSYTTGGNHTSESVCSSTYDDVWYQFTPSESGEYTFKVSLINGASTKNVGVYSGTPGYLNSISECDDIVLADLTANETYYIGVTSGISSQVIYFELCAYKSPEPPSNDDCTNPIALTVGTTFEDNYVVATNTSATVNFENSNFPTCGTLEFSDTGRDVWFTVTVPESGNVIIETRGEPGETNLNDTAMETYSGSCGTETLIPYYYNMPYPNPGVDYCSNQFVIGGDFYAGITFTDKTPGDVIFVRVWGWAYQFGKFRISAYDNSTLGIDDTEYNNEVSFYPNPTKNTLNIKAKTTITNISVCNILGKQVLIQHLNASSANIDMSHLAKGIYIVTVNSEYGSTNMRIVKN